MDIICTQCGEPWDIACLHEEAEYRWELDRGHSHREAYAEDREKANAEYAVVFNVVRKDFRSKGCAALTCMTGGRSCVPQSDGMKQRGILSGELMDLMGDDIDGIASMSEDFLDA